jgi:hypothetical protein
LVVALIERVVMAESMRGMRLGSQSMESDRNVEYSPRQRVLFRCPAEHEFTLTFSEGAELPFTWECKSCSKTAARLKDGEFVADPKELPDGPRTHYDMLLERRSREELEELLQEVLGDMRARRKAGKLIA